MLKRRLTVILTVGICVVLVVLVGGYLFVSPLIRTGSGYAAHNLCAVSGLAGRENAKSDLPNNPLVPYLTPWQGPNGQTRVTVAGFLAGQNAWYVDGFGCIVTGSRPLLPAPVDVPPADEFPSAETDPDIEAAIARAFGDDLDADAKTALGTRAVVILRHGVVVGERYAPGFNAQTRQLGWSMTKSIANLLTGRLVQEGKVALSDSRLVASWSDVRAKITIKDLLRMTSGLEWDEDYNLGTPITQMLYGEPSMASYVSSQAAESDPGTVQQYSSGSTTLLCSVLNTKAGLGPNLPREKLFKPLGVSSAVLEVDAAGTPVCSSYLWATPRDWARMGKFALDGGVVDGTPLLPAGWMKMSTTVEPVGKSDSPGLAASWWANRLPDGSLVEPDLPEDAFWASGHDGQRMYVVPSAGLVVVRMGFSPEVDDVRAAQLVADVVADVP